MRRWMAKLGMDERLLDVDQHGILRVPGVMWVGMALLARHWFWVIFTLLSARRSGESMILLSGGVPWWPMVVQFPAIVLLVAAGRRVPTAGPFVRNVWQRGYIIVAVTVLLNLCWTGWSLMNSQDWQPRPEMVLVFFSMLDLAIGWGFWSSRYIRQVWMEFPPHAESISR